MSISIDYCRRSRSNRWEDRQRLLDRARDAEKEGKLSDADIYVLNWILCGACDGDSCFGTSALQEKMYAETWDVFENGKLAARMLDHPAQNYLCKRVNALKELEGVLKSGGDGMSSEEYSLQRENWKRQLSEVEVRHGARDPERLLRVVEHMS